MAKDIVDKCAGCQFYSNMSHKPACALKTIPLVWPFAVWGLDMAGPSKTGASGSTHLLVAVDKFTKWTESQAHQEPWSRHYRQFHQRIDI